MIYGVEQSTDLRDPRTRIRRFRSEPAALSWAAHSGQFTYADPEGARNWHHTFRTLYRMPKGWRPPKPQTLFREAERQSTRDYPRTSDDMLAEHVRRDGERIEDA